MGAVYFRILNNKKTLRLKRQRVTFATFAFYRYQMTDLCSEASSSSAGIILTTGWGTAISLRFYISVRTDNSCNFFPAVDTARQRGMKSNNSQCYAGFFCVRIVCEEPVTGVLLPWQFPPVSHQYKKLPPTVSATTLFRTARDARTWHHSRLKPHYPL